MQALSGNRGGPCSSSGREDPEPSMRSVGPALRRLLHTHRTAKLARQPVSAKARRSVLMRELEDSRQEERADELESELPVGAADAWSELVAYGIVCCSAVAMQRRWAARVEVECGWWQFRVITITAMQRCTQACWQRQPRHKHMPLDCLLRFAVTDLVWDRPLTILNYPDPRLRAPNAKIGVFDERLQQLAAEMFDLMYE